MKMRAAYASILLPLIMAACGQTGNTPAQSISNDEEGRGGSTWTQAEVNQVQDLSQLGPLSERDGRLFLGEKSVDPSFTKGKFYGKNSVGHVNYKVEGFDKLSKEQQEYIKGLSPIEISEGFKKLNSQSVNKPNCWLVFCEIGSSNKQGAAAQGLGYDLGSSYTNMYSDVSTCMTQFGRITIKNNSVTQPNSSSYYLAVDSSIYFGTALKAKDFKEVGNTAGSQVSGVSLETSTTDALCFVPRDPPIGYGWHKGVQNQGESALIVTTSDDRY